MHGGLPPPCLHGTYSALTCARAGRARPALGCWLVPACRLLACARAARSTAGVALDLLSPTQRAPVTRTGRTSAGSCVVSSTPIDSPSMTWRMVSNRLLSLHCTSRGRGCRRCEEAPPLGAAPLPAPAVSERTPSPHGPTAGPGGMHACMRGRSPSRSSSPCRTAHHNKKELCQSLSEPLSGQGRARAHAHASHSSTQAARRLPPARAPQRQAGTGALDSPACPGRGAGAGSAGCRRTARWHAGAQTPAARGREGSTSGRLRSRPAGPPPGAQLHPAQLCRAAHRPRQAWRMPTLNHLIHSGSSSAQVGGREAHSARCAERLQDAATGEQLLTLAALPAGALPGQRARLRPAPPPAGQGAHGTAGSRWSRWSRCRG